METKEIKTALFVPLKKDYQN